MEQDPPLDGRRERSARLELGDLRLESIGRKLKRRLAATRFDPNYRDAAI